MDGSRFDGFVRALATGTTRRRTLQGLAGGAGLLGLAGIDAAAACVKAGQPGCKGPRNTQCCDGARCQGGTSEQEGRCICQQSRKRCGGKCVNLKHNRQHCGSCNERCRNLQVCRGGACRDRPCGDGGPCRVFITSTQHTGNLGGLAGADTICQGLADAARLAGTYQAWLSISANSPDELFTNTGATGPYRLVDGTQIAADFAGLTDGTLAAPIVITETGGRVAETEVVWTNTQSNGTTAGDSVDNHCSAWLREDESHRGNAGASGSTDQTWTNRGNFECKFRTRRLYCFQQG